MRVGVRWWNGVPRANRSVTAVCKTQTPKQTFWPDGPSINLKGLVSLSPSSLGLLPNGLSPIFFGAASGGAASGGAACGGAASDGATSDGATSDGAASGGAAKPTAHGRPR